VLGVLWYVSVCMSLCVCVQCVYTSVCVWWQALEKIQEEQ